MKMTRQDEASRQALSIEPYEYEVSRRKRQTTQDFIGASAIVHANLLQRSPLRCDCDYEINFS